MSRLKVLNLYQRILRTGRNWKAIDPKKTKEEQNYIKEEARQQFKANKNVTDQSEIQKLLDEGEARLEIAHHYRIPYKRPAYLKPGSSYDVEKDGQFKIRSGSSQQIPFGGRRTKF